MLKVSKEEVERDFARYNDIALREPVAMTNDGHNGTVLLSLEEYRDLQQNYRKAMRLEDFTEADIRAIEKSRPSPASYRFDHELDD